MTSRNDTARPGFNRKFILAWLRDSWCDMLVMAVIGGAAAGIHLVPVAPSAQRNFPLLHRSGDVVYPEFAYPHRGWIIKTWVSGLVCSLVPTAVILLMQLRERSFWDASNAISGLNFSLVLCTLVFVVVKQLIGGFRPYFLDVCAPDIRHTPKNATGLDAVGFRRMMYTADICTQPNKALLRQAMTSFPSGHSAIAFAGFGYLFLYMNAKLKVWADRRPAMWKTALTFASLIVAFLMACAVTIDQAHHWYDVVVGAGIGTATAFAAFRGSYAAIWDWRYNHIPLKRHSSFEEEESAFTER